MRLFAVTCILVATTSAPADTTEVFISESETTVAIGGAPWRVYLDVDGKQALDADGDGEADRFAQQYSADQAAKRYLRERAGGEAYTGLAGVPVFRHTVKGRTLVIGEPGKPTDPRLVGPPVELDPSTASIFIDAEGGLTFGEDTNDGLTQASAIESIDRAKDVAFGFKRTDASKPLAIRFRRGDTFGAFDLVLALKEGGGGSSPLTYTLFTGYSDGKRPVFEIGDATGFRFKNAGMGDGVTLRDLIVRGTGTGVGLNVCNGATIDGCDFEGAGILAQPFPSGTFKNLAIRDTLVWNCLTTGGHKQGAFLKGIDGLTIADSGFYRNGLKGTADMDDGALGVSVFNHGNYIKEDVADLRIENTWYVFNSGAGAQMRGGGDMVGCYVADNRRSGVDWGFVLGSPTTVGGVTGEITESIVVHSGAAWGLAVGNVKSGRVHGNLIVTLSTAVNRKAVIISADHGPNTHKDAKGPRVGINNLVIEGNYIDGDLVLQGDGWGMLADYVEGADKPEFGVLIRNNVITGKIIYKPHPGIVIEDEAGQIDQPKRGYVIPDRSAYIGKLLSREWRAADIIEQVKASE